MYSITSKPAEPHHSSFGVGIRWVFAYRKGMQYSKSPLTIEEQADKLIKRGQLLDKDALFII